MAQSCSFAIGGMNFGTINLSSNVAFTGTAAITGSCTGVAGRTVRLCADLGDGQYGSNSLGSPRNLSNGVSANLKFTFYTSAANTTVWGSYVWPWSASFPGYQIDIPIGSGGTGSLSTTLYGTIFAGQQTLTTGNYSSFFSSGHTLFQYGYSTLGTCAAGQITTASAQPTFTVSAAYPAACSLSITDLVFPNTLNLTALVDGTASMTITCSNGSPYTIGLSLGNGAGVTLPSARKMTAGAATVTYGLYRDSARSQDWGNTTGTNTLAGTGTGTAQSATIYGRVPVQTTPVPGTYIDNIVATITY